MEKNGKRPTVIFRGTKEVKSVYMRYHINGIERTINTPIKGKKEHFNARNGRFELRGNLSESVKSMYYEANEWLDWFYPTFARYFDALKGMDAAELTKDAVVCMEAQWLDLSPQKTEDAHLPTRKGKTRISDCVSLMDQRRGTITPSTLYQYKVNLSVLVNWAVERNLDDVDSFNVKMFRNFINKRMGEVGNSKVRFEIATVKQFAKLLRDNGLMDDDTAASIAAEKFSLKREGDSEKIALTEWEIEALWSFDGPSLYNKVRDIFVIQLETSQRISDVNGLDCSIESLNARVDNVDGVWMLTLTQKKTGKKVTAPISERAYRLLEMYGFRLPRIHMNHINVYLKEICMNCGGSFLDEITVTVKRGGRVFSDRKRRCDMVSTHTARRTAITRMLSNGVDVLSTMLISGHSSVGMIQIYNKRSGVENAKIVSNIMKGGK